MIVLAAVPAVLPIGLVGPLVPSRLTVHAEPPGWRSVRLDGKLISQSNIMVRVTPMDYGEHDLRIELANGKVVWATFFHSDTGVDRAIEISVVYHPKTDTVTFRETITRYEALPGRTRTVFTGSVTPEKTNPSHPFTLGWI